VAGGFESMSNVPFYLDKARNGYGLGNGTVVDGIIKDGLWDVYNNIHMGGCADNSAKKHGITREQQDEYAVKSYEKAAAAWKNGVFKNEIAPVNVGKDVIVAEDEEYKKVKFDKIPSLKPVFSKDGTCYFSTNKF